MMSEPIDAQTRGRLRLYRRQLAADYAAFDEIWKSITTTHQVEDFMHKSGKGRRRVFDRIHAAVSRHGARLEALRLDGKQPQALWSILRSRASVTVNPNHPRDDQDCICVNYFVVGALPDPLAGATEGLWSLEMTNHAAGRCLQRTPGVDLTEAIFAAHHALLAVDARDLPQSPERGNIPFRLRVGPATWMCEIRVGHEVSLNDTSAHIVVRNYLEFDQLSPRQESELMVKPKPEAESHRLGDSFLMPAPFLRLQQDGALVVANVFRAPPPLIALVGGAEQ